MAVFQHKIRWTMVALVALVLALAFGIWVFGQTVALRFALDQASQASGGRFAALGVRGTLYGAVRIARLTWRDQGLEVDAKDLVVRFSPRALLDREVRISRVHAARVHVTLPPPKAGPIPMPASLALPVPVDVASLRLDVLAVQGAAGLVVVEGIELAARYRDGRYRLEELRAIHRDVALGGGAIEMADTPPYALRGDVAASSGALARILADRPDVHAELRGDIAVALSARGDLERLDVDADARVAGVPLRASATIHPLAERPFTGAQLQLEGLDPRLLVPGAPVASLTATVHVGREGNWRGEIDATNARPSPIDQGGIPLERARAAFAFDEGFVRFSGLSIRTLGGATIGGTAAVALAGSQQLGPYTVPRGDARLEVHGLDLHALSTRIRTTRLDGTVALQGGALVLDLEQREVSELDGPLSMQARLRMVGREVLIEQARIRARAGVLRGAGSIWLDDGPRVAFSGEAEEFDPGRWLERRGLAQGRVADTLLNGTFRLDARIAPQLAGSVGLELRPSRWAGQTLTGSARARIETTSETSALRIARLSELDLDASLGGNRVRASGALGLPDDRLSFQITAPRLVAIDARATGQISLEGELRGPISGPAIRARFQGGALVWKDVGSIGALSGRIELPDLAATARSLDAGTAAAKLAVELRAERILVGATPIERIVLDTEGTPAAHRFNLSATGIGQTLQASGSGTYVPAAGTGQTGRWQAQVHSATLAGRVPASLRAPVTVSVGRGGVSVEQLSVALDEGAVAIAALRYQDGRLESSGELRALPMRRLLEWSEALAPASASVRPAAGVTSEIDGLRLDAKWELAGAGPDDLSGQVSARLREVARPGAPLLELGSGSRAELRLRAGALDGEVELVLPSLAFSRRYTGADWAADGEVRFTGRIAGTVRQPRFAGEITGRRLQLVQRSMGWRLANGSLRAHFDGETLRIESLRMESGEGSIELRGEAKIVATNTAPPPLKGGRVRGQFELLARKLPIPIGPGQRLIISGDTAVVGDEQSLRWTGRLRADEGLIELRSAGAPEMPDDVFIVDRRSRPEGAPRTDEAPVATRESPLRLSADLEIALGDRLKVIGGGIDAWLDGGVRLSGTLPEQPRAVGVVRVRDGSFTAYGQKLEIERGVVRFQGELDNPVLDIVAVRRYLPVTPGVAVTGTARSPRVKLVSTPELPDAEKLSWLVLGTGLDEAGGSAQVFALRQAASSLLGSDDGTLAGGIGQALGVDVLAVGSARTGAPTQAIADRGVPGETSAAGSAGSIAQRDVLTVGKRLSSRLFVSYEQGLRGVWNLLRIQYDISNRLSIRAQTGSESAVDLLWYYWFD